MKFSTYAQHYSSKSGIVQLMQDLSIAPPPGGQLYPMGGGNPAHIPEVEEALRQIANEVVGDTARFAQMVGDYDAPQGHERFRTALAERLSNLFQNPYRPKISRLQMAVRQVLKCYSTRLQAHSRTDTGVTLSCPLRLNTSATTTWDASSAPF